MSTQKKRPSTPGGGAKAPSQRLTRAQRTALASRKTVTRPPEESLPAVERGVDGLRLAVRLDNPSPESQVAVALPVAQPSTPIVENATNRTLPSRDAAGRGVLPGRLRGRTAPKVYALNREDEYRFIQEDMVRLLVIAAALLLLMIGLLFFLGR